MTIQKKSLISKLNTTKKAIVASTPTQENPSVGSTLVAKVRPPQLGKVSAAVMAAKKGKVRY